MPSKIKISRRNKIVLFFVVIAIVGLFLPINITSRPRNYFWQTVKPVGWVFRSSVGRVFPFVKDIFNLRRIVKQNTNLINENLELQSKLAKTSEVEYENEILKKELGFAKTKDLTQTTPAAIIGQSSGYLKSLVIDKGENDGIVKGSAVISQGYLVGTISEVRKNNSDVTLITDVNSLIPVILQNSRGTGLMRGGISGLVVEDIPLNITIQKGENILTSGLGGQIPQGILIGTVNDLTSKEGEIFQKVNVTSPVDFSRLEVLFVVKTND